jgi:hypothetical protein
LAHWHNNGEGTGAQVIDSKEDIIPVLDRDRRIMGDLRLSEVLLKALEARRQNNP